MTDFARSTTREARSIINNRKGNAKFHDNTYNVSYVAVDSRKLTNDKGIIPFQKMGGHVVNVANGLDLHYNDLDAFHRLHNRLYEKGAVKFEKMTVPNHENAQRDLRFPTAATNSATSCYAAGLAGGRNLFTGEAFTSPQVQQTAIEYKYARRIGTKSNTSWDKMLNRDDRDKGRDRAKSLYSSTKMCGLNVSYKAVDIEADHVVKFDPDGRYLIRREQHLRNVRAMQKIKEEAERRREAHEDDARRRERRGEAASVVGGGGGGGGEVRRGGGDAILDANGDQIPLFRRHSDRITSFMRPGTSFLSQQLNLSSAAPQQQGEMLGGRSSATTMLPVVDDADGFSPSHDRAESSPEGGIKKVDKFIGDALLASELVEPAVPSAPSSTVPQNHQQQQTSPPPTAATVSDTTANNSSKTNFTNSKPSSASASALPTPTIARLGELLRRTTTRQTRRGEGREGVKGGGGGEGDAAAAHAHQPQLPAPTATAAAAKANTENNYHNHPRLRIGSLNSYNPFSNPFPEEMGGGGFGKVQSVEKENAGEKTARTARTDFLSQLDCAPVAATTVEGGGGPFIPYPPFRSLSSANQNGKRMSQQQQQEQQPSASSARASSSARPTSAAVGSSGGGIGGNKMGPNRPQTAGLVGRGHTAASSSAASSPTPPPPPSFFAEGDPIAAFNKSRRALGTRNLSFSKAERFAPNGQRR